MTRLQDRQHLLGRAADRRLVPADDYRPLDEGGIFGHRGEQRVIVELGIGKTELGVARLTPPQDVARRHSPDRRPMAAAPAAGDNDRSRPRARCPCMRARFSNFVAAPESRGWGDDPEAASQGVKCVTESSQGRRYADTARAKNCRRQRQHAGRISRTRAARQISAAAAGGLPRHVVRVVRWRRSDRLRRSAACLLPLPTLP